MDKALVQLHKARKHILENKRTKYMLSYYCSLREWETVKYILNNLALFTTDPIFRNRYGNLFLAKDISKNYFGIGEIIVGSMSNMVFGGSVSLKVEDESAEEKLKELYDDGYFLKSITNTYKAAASTSGRAYLFLDTTMNYYANTDIKVNNEFIKFTVVPEFELNIGKNYVVRKFYKEVEISERETQTYEFKYTYVIDGDKCSIIIDGYNHKGERISDRETKNILDINSLYDELNFIPFEILDLGEGMLPNIVHIENALSENLYFQSEDLSSSQTTNFVPEELLYEVPAYASDMYNSFYDKYQTTKIVKSRLEGPTISSVPGNSAILTIERNLALNVTQAALDAKINAVSIGYQLTDKLGNNTDVGADRERATIRLREFHIDRLKPFISKVASKWFLLQGLVIPYDKITAIFAHYITPSRENLINSISKAVQFGIMSREKAVMELAKGELTQEEFEEEMDRITRFITQTDFNVQQNLEKGMDNKLKGLQIED